MKILLIENSYNDFIKSRLPYAQFLVNKGHTVFALVPDDEIDNASILKFDNILIDTYEIERNKISIFKIFKIANFFLNSIKKNNINIVHSFRLYPNLIISFAALFSNFRLILHITGLGIIYSNQSLKFRIYKLLYNILFQFQFLISKKVIFQNDDDFHDIFFNRCWKSKVKVIYGSGVNTDIYNSQNFDKEKLRSIFEIQNGAKVFTCVSRLTYEKGIKELCEAFESLNYLNAKLFIIGEPDKKNLNPITNEFILKYNQNKSIRFLGKKDNVIEYLAISDFFIYPSYYREGIPRALLEALAMGLPIITTNMPGCKLTVENGKNGYLIYKKTEFDIKNSIIKIINEINIENFKINSRIMALNNFSEKIIFEHMYKTYF